MAQGPIYDGSGNRIFGNVDGAEIKVAPGLVTLGEVKPPTVREARQVLLNPFGHTDFRVGQEATIAQVLAGKDGVHIAGTGSGKSLLYQVPAYLLHQKNQSTAIVISPLIALIRDQVRQLIGRGVSVAFLDGLQSPQERAQNLQLIQSGKAALVFVSPERFTSPRFWHDVLNASDTSFKLSFVAVDEFHCISRWGKDFRWTYQRELKGTLDAVRSSGKHNAQVFLCSATATAEAIDSALEVTGVQEDHFEHEGEIDRTNLSYSVTLFKGDSERENFLLERLTNDPRIRRQDGEKWLVMCPTRRMTERLAEEANRRGLRATAYHGGMKREQRIPSQESFQTGKTNLMFATSAFGMGVDIPDIRGVIHLSLTKSIEDYFQESGRAGRDGRPARCELWWTSSDFIYSVAHFIRTNNPPRERVIREYNRLLKGMPVEQQGLPQPTRFLNREEYFAESGEFAYLTPIRRSIMAVLHNCGAARFRGVHYTALVGTELETVLPTESQFREKLTHDLTDLKAVLVYAMSVTVPGSSPRRVLLNHLRHGTITEQVNPVDVQDILPIDHDRISRVLELVAARDWNKASLAHHARSGSLPRTHLIGVEEEPLVGMSERELNSIILYSVWCGLARLHRNNSQSWVSLTGRGAEWLADRLPESRRDVLRPATTFKKLQHRLGHSAERDTLSQALSGWWTEVSKGVVDDRSFRRIVVRSFFVKTFTVLDQEITGRELVRLFSHERRSEDVKIGKARKLLNYLFPDVIDDLAERASRRNDRRT